MTARSIQWQLAKRPTGEPTPDDVRRVEVDLPDLQDGEVRVENEFISVDPYMRGRMNDVPSYVPPFQLDEAMTGSAVGRVVESRSADLPVGTLVSHSLGWRDVAQGPAAGFRPVPEVPGVASSAHLGVLGLTGLTAYVGLTRIASIQEGDVVFVSGAAGAVGSMVGQIARLLGASRVVGSAGSAEKVERLTSHLGFDAAFDYHGGDLDAKLAEAAPDGIDLYFDNVGGDHLSAALGALKDFGRVANCGSISTYNSTGEEIAIRNTGRIVTRGLTLRGFTLGNHQDLAPQFASKMGPWLAEGRITADETVVDGIDRAFEAFTGLMRGENVGKMVVRTSASA
ncbi:NADP-dependent oxidoreductase [Clavibacter nebraskensis]|uniref:NADP-dependent oxidoreductase n=2 Tax=Clavibacter nebraskensis TaxID=31963 RepID=A0A399PKM3_9MICO|nr:NADP-dependent oxidoreductase [Clavibacter nebraskensis]KXU20230.1 NADP-dependent oxidoreductase [Clavibacter nebraskensis]OAH21493.1 NADP-dependent oxidoreductase [Clavibacter nebraskensis]QGV67168.1 NADP-dependent oxidoreductase [Clavibacter nebraskensis]QGV69967.1 NADP-dependent oxidoreductase [Clavibacter nebraskensis]QGV72758.1 NADP-dependent oxidoreductase [Clavibacter nebraskensis]